MKLWINHMMKDLKFQEHYDYIWIQDTYKWFLNTIKLPADQLAHPEQSELSYREAFVDPIIAKSFDDVTSIIKFNTGEIEAKTQKTKQLKAQYEFVLDVIMIV